MFSPQIDIRIGRLPGATNPVPWAPSVGVPPFEPRAQARVGAPRLRGDVETRRVERRSEARVGGRRFRGDVEARRADMARVRGCVGAQARGVSAETSKRTAPSTARRRAPSSASSYAV